MTQLSQRVRTEIAGTSTDLLFETSAASGGCATERFWLFVQTQFLKALVEVHTTS